MSYPRASSLQLLSHNVNGPRQRQKRAALFAVLQAGPWYVIALQETHHATQAEAAQYCRERAGRDGGSFWAAGASASRGVAFWFTAYRLLLGVSAFAADPCGRFVATQASLSGGHVTMASVYAPVERQTRTPFFRQCRLALPVGTPLLIRGDWNCVAEDLDLVGGQPGSRQHGFQSGWLPFQQALSLQDAFRCLHPQTRELTHTATKNASSARIDRWLVSDSLLPSVSVASVTDLILIDHYEVAAKGFGLCLPPSYLQNPHDSSDSDHLSG